MKSKVTKADRDINLVPNPPQPSAKNKAVSKIEKLNSSAFLLPNRIISHHPKAGVNLIVDAAGYLFSILGKLKQVKSYKQLNKLHAELVQEINIFFDTIKTYKFSSEYIIVCRYVLCATIDEIILSTNWGRKGGWENYSLLTAFNQDAQHQDKFFNILERIIKEPEIYIDLMELIFLCLSLGYKGKYQTNEHDQSQLEIITNNLYKHIRAYRGNFSKTLSPTSNQTNVVIQKKEATSLSLFSILISTACVIITIFISLGYIMDIITNEPYQDITQLEVTSKPEIPA